MNNVDFVIRKAQKEDITQIAKLRAMITGEYAPTIVPAICQYSDIVVTNEEEENFIKEMMEDPDYDVMVACIEENIVGMLSVVTETCSDDLIKAPYSTIEFMEVYPEFQSSGIGQAFIVEAEKLAKAKGHKYLELLVWVTEEKAIKLYEENSFQPITQQMVKKL